MGNSTRRIGYALFAVALAAIVFGGCKPRTHTSEEWLNPEYKNADSFHGSAFLSSSRPLCSVCHGRHLEGRKLGRVDVPGCSTCHFGPGGARVPPGASWVHGSADHSTQAASGLVCDACHQLYKSYGLEPQSCHPCHMPGIEAHEIGQPWLDRKSPNFHGTSTLACSTCHDLATKCSTCHFGPTGSKTPDGSGWTHGMMPHDSLEAYGSVCNQCHSLNRSFGNGPVLCHDCHGPHSVPFTNHGAISKKNLVYCQKCHAQPADAGPGSDPRFNVSSGSLTAGCESSGCHTQKTAHPVPWKGADATSHQTAGNMENACVLCHGATLAGSAGPACSTCHTQGLPTVMKNCASCHGKPPSSGAHAVHNVLFEVTTVCSACHSGAGSQTASHQNGTVEVSLAGFNAKSGTASYSAAGMTCSNVSCHGGQVTPRWDTGAIDVNTQCTACHSSSSSQYNSFRSGEHQKHVSELGADCTECHDTTKLVPVHFNDLATTAMPDASQTIRSDRNYNGSSCLFTCHLNNEQHDRGMNW